MADKYTDVLNICRCAVQLQHKGKPPDDGWAHSDRVRAVAVYAGGRRAISASYDRTLKVWDLEAGAHLAGFTGEGAILACAVAPDGHTIVAGDGSGPVHFLRLEGVE